MHKLGEQWIEIIDGQEHMVRAVEKISEKSYDCTGCIFNGHNGTCMYHSQDCPLGEVEYGYIKDLGVLRDGLLPCPFCGEYPEIVSRKREDDENGDTQYEKAIVCRGSKETTCQIWGHWIGSSDYLEEAIDAWNRRV